jgi:ketosteroid isomerase-like protein
VLSVSPDVICSIKKRSETRHKTSTERTDVVFSSQRLIILNMGVRDMGAPSPELCNLWLARAFNAQDVDAAAAMYHPDASIVQVDEVHGGSTVARGADGIRKTMAAYVGLKPHMDVVTHHTTVSGDFAMTRSQWLIKGIDENGRPTEVHHHGMEVHRRMPDGSWVFFMDHPFGADPNWAVEAPPHTE